VGLEGSYDLYALWSVERVAALYGLTKIGDKEWYPGFARLLIHTQRPQGQWRAARAAPIDTCFALLVLRRSNLLPDLAATLRGKDPEKPHRRDVPAAAEPPGKPSSSVRQLPLRGNRASLPRGP
jgi:hypothetical protein